MPPRNMTIRIPDDLMETLKDDAEANLRSITATVHIILRSHYQQIREAKARDNLHERMRATERAFHAAKDAAP